MKELINERDYLGETMQFETDKEAKKDLFNTLKDIEYDLYKIYGIYPVYTGFGWRPPTPRKYNRAPRVPVRQIYSPVLSSIPEHKAIYFRKSQKQSTRSKRRSTRSKRRSTRSKRRSTRRSTRSKRRSTRSKHRSTRSKHRSTRSNPF